MKTTTPRFRTRPLAAALITGLGLGAYAGGAFAATQIAVTTTDDAGSASTCTLRQAIAAMNTGVTTGSACVASTISGVDTIVFDTTTFPPHGANTITLADAANNQLSITDANLVIDASANDNVTVQRAATATNAFGIFYDIAYGTLTIDSLTIANGKLGAAQPSGYAFGAGITCVCSNLTLRNSKVMDNAIATSVYAAGGGVFVYTGDLTMTGSTVSGNSVSGFSGASGHGGGVFVRQNIDTQVGGNATISDSTISDNIAKGNGGGLHVGGTLALSDSTISGNTAANGGGIKLYGVSMLTRSTISGNTATGHGGGIIAASGYYGVPAALLTLDSSTLSGNQATSNSGRGGGIFTRIGDLAFVNSTIANNIAAGAFGYGGAIYVKQNTSPITIQQTTIAANTAGNRGGGLMIMTGDAGAVDVDNSLFTYLGTPTSGGGNIAVNTGSITIAGAGNLVFGNSLINAAFSTPPLTGDPKLGALRNNGGATQTMLPASGSAAIDAIAPVSGHCATTTDQRGVSRPQGIGCDIGAVENDTIFANGFDSPPPPVQCSGASGSSDVLIENFDGPALSTSWAQNTNGGSVSVNHGVSLSSNGFQTPFIASATPIIPASGDFSVRWQARYTNVAGRGTGTLVLSNGLPVNNTADNYALRSADAWQDAGAGFNVRVRTNASTYASTFAQPASAGTTHDIEYCWIGNNIEVWIDGARTLQAPNAGLTRPTSLWFGNPVNAGTTGAWSSFTLDHVYVRSVSH